MFVKRDASGKIEMVCRTPASGCEEEISDDSAELLAFLDIPADPVAALRASDLEVIRVLDDLISLLTEKGVICFTDLPEAAQLKLSGRQQRRQALRRLNLVDEDDQGIL